MKKRFRRWIYAIIIILITILSYIIPTGLEGNAKIVFSLLIFGALFWATETIPLWLTSLVITVLIILLRVFTVKVTVQKFADPILLLILSGFLIGGAMHNLGLDKRIAMSIASRVTQPKMVLLALMCVAAFLSMWMSNTASTVITIPIALALVKRMKGMGNFCKASVLGIAFSANVGGMGTIIGTPPNAIAVAKLSEIANVKITFLMWMGYALPLVIVLTFLIWVILISMFKFDGIKLDAPKRKQHAFTRDEILFISVFILTIILWLTSSLHGYSSTVVALVSVTALFLIGLLKRGNLNKVSWDALILLGGGLVLGSAMYETGIAQMAANYLSAILGGVNALFVIAGVAVLAIGISTFTSNTSTAAILLPVLIPLAAELGISAGKLGVLGGLAVSLVFLFPMGTPPNAIAYSTGKIKIRDMLKAGSVITAVTITILVLYVTYIL